VLSKNDARMTRSDNPDLLSPPEATEIAENLETAMQRFRRMAGALNRARDVCALGMAAYAIRDIGILLPLSLGLL